MQFQVPQFIETEDKIVGPLSLKQFIYIAIAGGISLFLYFVIASKVIWIACSIFFVAAAGALGFVKYQGQSLPQLILNAFLFIWQPKMYVWQPESPHIEKTPSTMKDFFGGGLDLEKIVAGNALKKVWQTVETGQKKAPDTEQPVLPASHMNYQAFRKQTGDRAVVRKIDYR
jgi:hypothetical protein